MNDDESRRLVALLIDTWPGHVVKGYVWADVLGDLTHTHAQAAYTRLRRDLDRPPSVARFIAEYHVVRVAAITDPTHETPPICQLCDGTGWVDALPIHEPIGGKQHPYTQVTTCHCTRGQHMRPAHARILEANSR